jgi:integrase
MKVGDRATAEQVAKDVELRIARGEFNLDDKPKSATAPTFGEVAQRWAEYVKATRRESTHERYAQVMRRDILPAFKKRIVDQITRGDVRDFLVGRMQKGQGKGTVMIQRDVMSGVFNFAVDEELVKANPVRGISKSLHLARQKEAVEEMDAYNKEEIALFLETCRQHCPEYYALFFMAARTGMRIGEVIAVQWGDVDFNSAFIRVCRAYRRGVFSAPKNGKARRVDMSVQLMDVLRDHERKQKRLALKRGWGAVPDLVSHRNGVVIEQNYIRRQYKRVLKKAGLRELKLHALRHSFASQLLSMGESPVYVQRQLGHHSIQITCDIYGHWIRPQDVGETAVNKLDDIIDEAAPACTLSAPSARTSRLKKP